MKNQREMECPHCKKIVPITRKRHDLNKKHGYEYLTLCGKPHEDGRLLAKENETVNCRNCMEFSDRMKTEGRN